MSFFPSEKRLKQSCSYTTIIKRPLMIKLKLTSTKILDQVFPGKPRGYDPLVVDQYLDKIIQDYVTVENNVLMMKKEVDDYILKIQDLEEDKKNLEIELSKYKSRFANIKGSDNVTSDNLELLKKIHAYEIFLFQHGFNPEDIYKSNN